MPVGPSHRHLLVSQVLVSFTPPACGLCASDRRTRAPSSLVVPPVGTVIADLPYQVHRSTPAVLLVALVPLWMLTFSRPDLRPHLGSRLLPSRGVASIPVPYSVDEGMGGICVNKRRQVCPTRACYASCSTAAGKSCNVSPLLCTLALSCDR